MNRSCSSPTHFFQFIWILASAACLLLSPVLRAVGPPPGTPSPVVYNPDQLQSVQGDAPLSYTYTLQVTSPSALPVGSTTVSLALAVISSPAGSSDAAALSYVSFSVPTLNFTGPGQARSVVVRLLIPAGSVDGDFSYLITTSGWPAGYNIADGGTRINAHVNPPGGLVPPLVAITSPADDTIYNYTLGTPPILVPIKVTGSATNSAPLLDAAHDGLTASITGYADDDSVILPTRPLALVITGLGTANAEGVVLGGFPVSAAGTYTVAATATNSEGTSVTSNDFYVVVGVTPPVVEIVAPTEDFTYIKGISAATVAYSIKARSSGGGIMTLSATLDGDPIAISSLIGVSADGVTPGQAIATGTGSWVFSTSVIAGGTTEHTLSVTTTDLIGSASATSKFKVTELLPAITTVIPPPLDGSVIPMPPDASNLLVPVVFTSTASPTGATVKAVSATLDGSPMTITSTTLNRASVTGTGSLSFVSGVGLGGTHTIVATGSNSSLGLVAIDDATFTITPPPPPTITITQSPLASYGGLLGHLLSIPFTFKTSNTGAYIKVQSATLDGLPVSITDTANSTAFSATGSGILSVLTPLVTALGLPDSHELVVTGTDVYGQTVSTSVPFTVGVSAPAITIAINPQIVANSPYTMPTSGALSIPFTFTGTITPGATVDTITGNLGLTTNVTISSTTGLGTSALATASGNLSITAPGTYTVTATDTNTKSGISATTSATFVVKAAQTIPPLTVTITQPPAASYTLTNGCSPLCIPITFVGNSNGGKVSTMTATLDGVPISLSSLSGIGYSSATGKANLSVSTAGNHVLVVKDTDNYGQTATATATFNVVIQNPAITVTVNSPSNGSTYYLTSSGCTTTPISIPFNFTSAITAGATISKVSATLNGCSVTIGSTSGLGTASATGSGTLNVSQAGTYTLRATGTSAGCGGLSASSSVTFTVVKASPPTVAITAPTQCSYVYLTGGSAVSVPFTFVGKSTSSTISKLTATLNGQSIAVSSSGIGSATATGTGTLSFTAAGSYVLSVSAVDSVGTATAKTTITVTVKCPTPTVDFTKPDDCATITYVKGDAVPTIPFSFTAKTSTGATISSIKATFGCNNVAVSATGVGTQTAIGTGTLTVSGPGSYTLTATAVSGGVTVTDKVCFTVVQVEPVKTCTTSWLPPISSGQAQTGGCSYPVKFQVQNKCTTGTTTSCTTVRDTSVKIAVYEVYSNGSCGPAKTYSSSNYSIDSNNCYNLSFPAASGKHTYRAEVYCYPSGSNTPKLVGSKDFCTK